MAADRWATTKEGIGYYKEEGTTNRVVSLFALTHKRLETKDSIGYYKEEGTTNGVASLFALTHKRLEIYGGEISSEATDGLVLKHQAISIHRTD